MWANNIFSLEENRAFVAPSQNFPSYNYKSPSTYNCKTWAPSSNYASSYTPKFTYKSSGSSPVVSSKAINTHRVIAFNSSASWRGYFEASKATNKLIVVEFTATWCGPCRKMEPAIDEFAAKYSDVDFVKIDVDKLFDISCDYGVQTMPTFLLMKKGKVIDKVTGAKKEELQRKIETNRV